MRSRLFQPGTTLALLAICMQMLVGAFDCVCVRLSAVPLGGCAPTDGCTTACCDDGARLGAPADRHADLAATAIASSLPADQDCCVGVSGDLAVSPGAEGRPDCPLAPAPALPRVVRIGAAVIVRHAPRRANAPPGLAALRTTILLV